MTGYARGVDNSAAPALEHRWNFVAHRIENAPHVDVEDASIFRFSCLIKRALPFNTGVVKRDVEPAEFVDSKVHHRFHVRLFGDISAYERCLAPQFLDFGDNWCTFLFAPAA